MRQDQGSAGFGGEECCHSHSVFCRDDASFQHLLICVDSVSRSTLLRGHVYAGCHHDLQALGQVMSRVMERSCVIIVEKR